MLYILNTRKSFRLGDASLSGMNSTHNPSRARTAREVELGVLSGIQVHTQIETSRNHDVRRFVPDGCVPPLICSQFDLDDDSKADVSSRKGNF